MLSALQVLLWRASIVPTVEVAVSKTGLVARSPISASEITPVTVPETAVLKGMVTSFAQIAHLYPIHAIPAGAYLTTSEFEPEPLRDGLCPGEVSVTVGVQNAADAEGIYPGMYVDVTQPLSSTGSGSQLGPGVSLAKGLRVIGVLNSNGQPLSDASGQGLLNGLEPSDTPSMVELALPSSMAPMFINASAKEQLVFSQDPWATPKTVCSTSGAQVSGEGGPQAGATFVPGLPASAGSPTSPPSGQTSSPARHSSRTSSPRGAASSASSKSTHGNPTARR
jgi:hypothetical protein